MNETLSELLKDLTGDYQDLLPWASIAQRHEPNWSEMEPAGRRLLCEVVRDVIADSSVIGLVAKHCVVSDEVRDLLKLADKQSDSDIPF